MTAENVPMLSVPLSRRRFLRNVGIAGGAIGVLGSGSFFNVLRPEAALAAAAGQSLPPATPILVMVELAGANDTLNTHIPHNVNNVSGYYYSGRPTIGIKRISGLPSGGFGPPPAGDYLPPGLDLGDGYAFHGALPWLANRWHQQKDVAIIQGIGEDVMKDMSHFGAMSYRWAAAFTGPLMATGWLGRYNDLAHPGVPLEAVSVGGVHQSLASKSSPSTNINDVGGFAWSVASVPDQQRFLADFIAMGDPNSSAPNKVATAARALSAANDEINRVKSAGVPSSSSNDFSGQMNQIAALINAGIPCQTYVVVLGGFDTHSGQPYAQWERLTALNSGLKAFFADLGAGNRSSDVAVMVTSEFGRQVTQNAGQGTDHGRASSAFVIGGGAVGGRYGAMPDLTPAARYFDAMVPTVDFRSLFATILNKLGGSPALTQSAMGLDESGKPFADLGVFRPGSTLPPAPPTVPGATTVPGSTKPGDSTMPSTTMPTSTKPGDSTMPSTTMPTSTMPTSTMPTSTMPTSTMPTSTMPSTTTTKPPTTTKATTTTTSKPRRRLSLGTG